MFGRKSIAAIIIAGSAAIGGGLSFIFSAHHHDHSNHQTIPAVSGELAGESLYQLQSRWVDESGDIRLLRDFTGQPVVMAMIYTSCEYACPLIIGDMMKIYNALPDEKRTKTQFLLVSFDPARDTPEKMGDYKQQHLPNENWSLISADDGDTLEFSIALGIRYKPIGNGDFSHSNTIIILDTAGREIYRQDGLGSPPNEAVAMLQSVLAG